MSLWSGILNVINSTVNSVSNILGTQTDLVTVPHIIETETAMAFLHTGYYHVHGASFIYPKYAIPVQLTSATAAWATTGTIVEIIPANTIIKNFDLHWCSISDISANLFGVIDIYAGGAGAEVLIGSVDVNRTINFSREGTAPIQIPQQTENTRISARFTDSTTSARTVRIKFYGHVYSSSLT